MDNERSTRETVEQETNKAAGELFNQQMWCFGKDIRRPEGNLLIEYGFDLFRQPKELTGRRYEYHLSDGQTIVLVAGGMVVVNPNEGSAHFDREYFVPKIDHKKTVDPNYFYFDFFKSSSPKQVQKDKPFAQHAMITASRWLADYEQFVLDTAGREYREGAIASWNQKRSTGNTSDLWAKIHAQYNQIF